MEWFNARVTVDRLYRVPEDDDLIDRLDGWHPSISAWPDGRLSARISLTTESMIDAAAQALAVVREASGTEPVALDLMTEREFLEWERWPARPLARAAIRDPHCVRRCTLGGADGMGYYERKAGQTLLGMFLIVCVISLVAIGPWMIGDAIAGPILGAVLEALYIIGIIWLIAAQIRKARRQGAERVQAAAALAVHRVQMARTGDAWFDPGRGHFTHSTCSVRHRTIGAAQRCKGTV